jgi:serine/threonine-protein kinase
VRQVSAALALDPENVDAQQLLVRLLVEPPARVPPEVQSEMAAAGNRNLQQLVRFGAYGVASWLIALPVVAAIGVRAWRPILVTTALCLIALATARRVRRLADLSFSGLLALTGVVLATIDSVTCFLGPFVLVPQILAVVTIWIALQCRTPRERYAIVAFGSAATALPFLIEMLGIFPPAYAFSAGNLTLFSRAIALSARTTVPLLFYASVASVALPTLFLSTIRQRLTVAERQLFLHAWHLRQILPTAAPATGPESAPSADAGGATTSSGGST